MEVSAALTVKPLCVVFAHTLPMDLSDHKQTIQTIPSNQSLSRMSDGQNKQNNGIDGTNEQKSLALLKKSQSTLI